MMRRAGIQQVHTYTLVGVGGNDTRIRSGINVRASTALKRVGNGSRQRRNDGDSKDSSHDIYDFVRCS